MPINEKNDFAAAVRYGKRVEISLDHSQKVDKDDILIFAAIKENGLLRAVIMPQIEDMFFIVPDGMEDAEITIYVWNKNQQPYTDPIKVD